MIQAHKQRLYLVPVLMAMLALTGCPNRGDSKDVMAKVNGYKVLRSEVDKTFNQQLAGSPQKPTSTEEEALRLNILSQIIYRQLLLQKAEKLGVVATDDEVETKFNQAKAPYTQEQFQKQLKDSGMTEEDYKLDLRRNLTVEKLLNKEIASKVNISDADIGVYYDQNKAEFNLIEPRYRLATIYVSNQPSGEPGQSTDKARLDAQAKAKIQMIHNRLDSGEDFADLAQKYSDDPDTGRAGGAVQPIPESQVKNFDPVTRDAVQRLKPGQYSEILPSINPQTHQQNGYQIVRLNGKDIAGQRDLNDPQVQQFIRSKLRNQREQVLRAAYDEQLRNNAQVHNYFAEQILNKTGGK
ncbi:MAG TPA: SurA N-terminal domain-containing protein [Candidatus Angelobacter sp.]|nr:SurA N-terminal domain-containing protein [Candidatus Angelobacter sp.]